MSNSIPIRDELNRKEAQTLLAEDEAYIKSIMEITVELNSLAIKAAALMKDYINSYQKITAPAKVRPRGKNDVKKSGGLD